MKKSKKLTPEQELEKAIQEHNELYERWEHLYKFGGQDPCWEDGCNMSLVRNHITISKRRIKELCEELNQPLPECYHKELPIEVDRKYMARADEIRANAKKSLEAYKADKDYQYLSKIIHNLNKNQIRQTSIDNVVGYCTGLETYIKEDSLVDMRRHEKAERYLDSFKTCRKRVAELEPEEFIPRQVDLFSLI